MAMLEVKSAQHLKNIFQSNGFDTATGQRHTIMEVLDAATRADKAGIKFTDAMSVSNLQPLMPQTIVQVLKESVEPLMIGPSLLDRIQHQHGQTITFPAIGAVTADDVGEGMAYPEVQFQIGGATVTVAGGLLANFYYITPTVGMLFVMIAFATVALGGFGSIWGAFFAGLLIGVIEMVTGHYLSQIKITFVYLAYFLVVVLRPRGLSGW